MKWLNLIRLSLFAALIAGITSLPSHADTIVSVKLDSAQSSVPSAALAGVVPAANWNNAPNTASGMTLVNQLGLNSGMTLTIGTYGGTDARSVAFTTNATGNNAMMKGELYNSAGRPIDLNFTSTTAFQGNLYIYYRTGTVDSKEGFTLYNSNGTVNLGYATLYGYEQSANGPSTSFVTDPTGATNSNYVEFIGLNLPLGFRIEAKGVSGTTLSGPYAFINGVEFVTVAVPEPSTYALIGLGLGVLVLLQNRRRN